MFWIEGLAILIFGFFVTGSALFVMFEARRDGTLGIIHGILLFLLFLIGITCSMNSGSAVINSYNRDITPCCTHCNTCKGVK